MSKTEERRTSAQKPLQKQSWSDDFSRRIFLTDVAVLAVVVAAVQIIWFGFNSANLAVGQASGVVSYTFISVAIFVAWLLVLSVYGTRGRRVVGTGTQEYKLIADATVRLFGLVAIIAFLFQIDFARGYILLAFPVGLIGLLFTRWIWRKWLAAKRAQGEYAAKVLLVGSAASVTYIARELSRRPDAGYLVIGACVPTSLVGDSLPGTSIPVFGNFERITRAMEVSGADTVVITSADELPPERVRDLSWALVPGKQHLVVAPSLVDIGGPRIHTRPVAGLPLIHVETPRYEGSKRFAKRTFDICMSLIFIALASPFLLACALLVKVTSPGPVLFRQERVGYNGTKFHMLKFRSMVIDAEERLLELQKESRAEGNAVMFKMRDDPRVTSVGRVMRRFSIDELPQLFNVFGGSMSLVGPRPPLEREVDQYEKHVHRRFMVKPGITGLWQVSGRSNLSWEDTVRLDLFYVENWSLTGDLVILWRTAKAVVASEGAY
ncbi:sugar transferase [Herbiconiux flava]|uniref:Exopolysaccharide biosynthesis polyprenyl glycosylphosphotransferase n=1 Tax=Herbiconiux flava TaxID=881268 RepID=A0A852S967_9MICO|nr:sugar transferase [Herbiconiux flava]NYD68912.1 exopolysaccharide biosynthesis polyprenyl glycosylphosphotransferase [Herbiconiux flava]GLK15657.1 polyprenyl glycosylphosphotransferase [Herbiconiux flava]